MAIAEDVTTFLPDGPFPSDSHSLNLNAHLFAGLVRLDRSLDVEAALAESWISPDDRTYVFQLRPDLRFSDGRALTSTDVVASLEAVRGAAWGGLAALHAVESVRALDERRIEIRTRSRHPPFLPRLHLGFVLPAEDLAPGAAAAASGPYVLREWHPGESFTLEANPNYYGGPLSFPRAVFRVVSDAAKRVRLLVSGEVDIVAPVPLHDVPTLSQRDDIRVYSGPGTRVLYLGLRADRPPFSDPRVREAVACALDRQALVEGPLHGRGLPAHQLVPGSIVGYDPTLGPQTPGRRCRDSLAAAGYPEGLSVRLDGPRDHYVADVELLGHLAAQLGAVGIRVEVQALEAHAFFERINSGRSDMHLVGWAFESGEASDLLTAGLHSKRGPDGALNTFGLSDPVLDGLVDAVTRSRDERAFGENLKAALRHALDLDVAIPLVVQPEAIALRSPLRWHPTIDYSLWLPDLETEP